MCEDLDYAVINSIRIGGRTGQAMLRELVKDGWVLTERFVNRLSEVAMQEDDGRMLGIAAQLMARIDGTE